ncbi:MAG: hypothetical protein ACLT8E_10820 [Akkermansia sp.]
MVSFTGVAPLKTPPWRKPRAGARKTASCWKRTPLPAPNPPGRMNEPAHLIHMARFIAASRGMELDELARARRKMRKPL